MSRSGKLIHGGWLVRCWDGLPGSVIEEGALYEEGGRILAVGTLAEGNWADVVLLSRPDIEGVPGAHPVAELLLRRGCAGHVRTAIIGGRVMIEDGRWKHHDPSRTLSELAEPLTASAPSRMAERLKDAVCGYLHPTG
jgi:cytosine/adenosine deaminase-related metal-dependent hydrolase